MRPFLLIAALALPLAADVGPQPVATRVAGDAIQWVDPMVALPAGAKIALLEGFPRLALPFTIRVQLPSSRSIGPYSTNDSERITVLSGRVRLTTPPQPAAVYGAGSFFFIPPTVKRTIEALDDAVIQVSSVGPWPSAPGTGFPPTETIIPTTADGMSMEIVSIDPPSNAIVNLDTVVHAKVRYSIAGFQPGYYQIVPMVETADGTKMPVSVTSIRAYDLEHASGTLTFEVALGNAITDRAVKKPIKFWFFVTRKTGDNRSRPELRTPTVEYLSQ